MSAAPCPHCLGTGWVSGPLDPGALANEAAALREWCAANAHTVLAPDLVPEPVAAVLLGWSAGHLKNLRTGSGQCPPSKRIGRASYYALRDLAEFRLAA